MKKAYNQEGFLLISLIIVIAIIAILFTMYYQKGPNGQPSEAQTGQKAIEQTKENNAAQLQDQMQIQNELNGGGGEAQTDHAALNQAKTSLQQSPSGN